MKWVACPGTRSRELCTPQARTTPSAMSLSRTGCPTVFTRSRNSSSLPGLTVYPYQKVRGCIACWDCCAIAEMQDNNIAKRHKSRRFFIVSLSMKFCCLHRGKCVLQLREARMPRAGTQYPRYGKGPNQVERCVGSITGIGSGQDNARKPPAGEPSGAAACFRTAFAIVLSLFFVPCLGAQPETDYHQHLFSPRIAKLAPGLDPLTSADLIALLDKAGIRRAVVLSIAYQYSSANRPPIDDEYARVKEENDWTSQQVARYPDRLRGFCSV